MYVRTSLLKFLLVCTYTYMLPEISVSLYVRTDFLKFQEMIFKFPRKFVRLDLKSTFPVLENSGSVRFQKPFIGIRLYGTNFSAKKVCRVGGYPLLPLRTDAKRRFSEPSLRDDWSLKLRDSASSFHWLSSSIFSCSFVCRRASVTSPLISTI